MKKFDNNYLFCTGDQDEEYGLYVMAINCILHTEDSYLMYYFDGDKFIHRDEKVKDLFVNPPEINSCKDEFGNVYSGEDLYKRMQEAISAYKAELPGYVSYFNETEIEFRNLE